MSKALLVNYVGRPLTLSSLLPDNGLANMAASLLENNYEVKILDYSTINTIKRLRYPEKESKTVFALGKKIAKELQESGKADIKKIEKLHTIEEKLDSIQNEKRFEIAKEITNIVGEENADFVGLKLWNGDGFKGSLMIAEELKKEYPSMPIFAGGPHVEWFKDLILKETDNIDAINYGDGEETIVHLADYVQGKKKLKDIPNLIYKNKRNIKKTKQKWIENLEDIPFPMYDKEIYPSMKDDQKIKIFVLDESRGCPYSCNFCIHPQKSGDTWRTKSKKRIINEMEYIMDNYGSNAFVFAGSTTPPKLLNDIAKEILERGLKVDYTIFGNFKGTKTEDYKLLKESGCYAIFFGLESGSEMILDKAMNKKTPKEKIKKALNSAKDAGIYTIASVIYPAPFETEETRKETLDLLIETKPDSVPLQFPGLIPGSRWTNNPEKFNFEVEENYEETLLNYKVKLLFPPSLWDSLPFKCNDDDFLNLVKKSGEFVHAIEKNGILTAIPQDLALIIKNLDISPKEFRDKDREHFLTGDYKKISNMIEKVNRNVLNNNYGS